MKVNEKIIIRTSRIIGVLSMIALGVMSAFDMGNSIAMVTVLYIAVAGFCTPIIILLIKKYLKL